MTNQVWIWIVGIVVLGAVLVILIADPWHWRESQIPALKAERDSLFVEAANWKRLYEQEAVNRKNCEERGVVRIVETVPVPDERALQYVLATLRETKDSLEAAKKIAEKLQPSLFSDPIGFKFEDDFIRVGLYAAGAHYPLEGRTEIQYNMTDYELKKKQIVLVDNPVPIYVSSAFIYIEAGGGYSWTYKQFQFPINFGLNADLSDKWSVNIEAIQGLYRAKTFEVSSEAKIRFKL